MKVVIAPDSFKESLSAAGVAAAMAAGVKALDATAEVLLKPMADGGEGTVEAIVAGAGGELREADVSGPLGETVHAQWGWLSSTRTAVIEIAQACGLQLVPESSRAPLAASSFGCGQLILQAIDAGAERIVLGLGGSATTDGGSGMLAALGLRLLDAAGKPLAAGGDALAALDRIDDAAMDARLGTVRFEVASDVDNPLCGPDGAAAIYAPQKGAQPAQVLALEAGLSRLADVVERQRDVMVRTFPGSGAAGGLGFAARAFLNAAFRPGVSVVADLVDLTSAIRGADLVLTGEGRLDHQTLRGKTPLGVATIARQLGVPVIAIAGTLGEGYQRAYAHGIDAAVSLVPGPMELAVARADAARLLRERTEDVLRIWYSGRRASERGGSH